MAAKRTPVKLPIPVKRPPPPPDDDDGPTSPVHVTGELTLHSLVLGQHIISAPSVDRLWDEFTVVLKAKKPLRTPVGKKGKKTKARKGSRAKALHSVTGRFVKKGSAKKQSSTKSRTRP